MLFLEQTCLNWGSREKLKYSPQHLGAFPTPAAPFADGKTQSDLEWS